MRCRRLAGTAAVVFVFVAVVAVAVAVALGVAVAPSVGSVAAFVAAVVPGYRKRRAGGWWVGDGTMFAAGRAVGA